MIKKILLLIVISISALYFFEKYQNSKKSFEVVIARYYENLNWVAKEFPNEKITIYNKGKDDITPLANWKIIKLPNIGRESHTYLYHIIANYNHLADRTLFLQGDPYGHMNYIYLPLVRYKTKAFNHITNKCRNVIARCGDSVSAYIKSYYKKDKDRLDSQSTELSRTRHGSFRDGVVDQNLDTYVSDVIGRNLPKDTILGWAMGALFAAEKEQILHHSKQYYQKILSTVDKLHPEEGYYIEKSWDLILDNGNYKDIKQ